MDTGNGATGELQFRLLLQRAQYFACDTLVDIGRILKVNRVADDGLEARGD